MMDINPTVPLVSIITVVFNGSESVEKTILSVLSQSYQNKEYIIIDGCSTDGTVDIIRKYDSDIDHWLSEKDKGIYDAMNKGIALASGTWINFMNSGDQFASQNVLDDFAKSVGENDDILFGDALVEYPTFKTLYPVIALDRMWKKMPFCHQATFFKGSLLKEWKFDLRYRLSSDYDLLYRAYLEGRRFRYVKTLICNFDFKDSVSKKNLFISVKERRNIVLKRSYSIYKWLYYACVLGYAYFAVAVKQTLGDRLTQRVTKMLRNGS
jgi:glycosyltransferase involved in cell wall biosynthesis